MLNQTKNQMNIVSGVWTAPLVDGLYLLCGDVRLLSEIYDLLHTLSRKEQYAEALQLLRVLAAIADAPEMQELRLLSDTEAAMLIQNVEADFFEVLCEYKTM